MTGFVAVPPPPDGLRLALAAARQRRLRVASLTTAAGASLALVVPLLLGSSGQSVLSPEPDPRQPAVTVSHPPAPAGVPDLAGAGVPGRAPGRPQQAPAIGPTRAPRSASPGTAVATRAYAAGPLTRQDNLYASFGALCFRADGSKPTGLCTAGRSVDDGQPGRRFEADVCNVDTTATELRFPTSSEVDFTVRSSTGAVVWRWSQWHPRRPDPHSLVVQPSACEYWSFRWSEVDSRGRRLPAGSYALTVSFGAAGLDPETTSFTL